MTSGMVRPTAARISVLVGRREAGIAGLTTAVRPSSATAQKLGGCQLDADVAKKRDDENESDHDAHCSNAERSGHWAPCKRRSDASEDVTTASPDCEQDDQ